MAVYLRVRATRLAVRQASLIRVTQRVLDAVGEAQSELSVELIGDGRMRRLNREYRKKDRTTDVLAFAMREAVSRGEHEVRGTRQAVRAKFLQLRASRLTPDMLGDVVISVPTARRQAKAAGRSLEEELAWLLVHGVLHLCGYDHERSEQEARRMRRKERAVLQTVLPLPKLVNRTRHASRLTSRQDGMVSTPQRGA